jgi:hypothetical protein
LKEYFFLVHKSKIDSDHNIIKNHLLRNLDIVLVPQNWILLFER